MTGNGFVRLAVHIEIILWVPERLLLEDCKNNEDLDYFR